MSIRFRFPRFPNLIRSEDPLAPNTIQVDSTTLDWRGIGLYCWNDPTLRGLHLGQGVDTHVIGLGTAGMSRLVCQFDGGEFDGVPEVHQMTLYAANAPMKCEWGFESQSNPIWHLKVATELVERVVKQWVGENVAVPELNFTWSIGDPKIGSIYAALIRELSGKGWGDLLYVDYLAIRLALRLLRSCSTGDRDRFTRRAERLDFLPLAKSIEYMRQRPTARLRLTDIAKAVDMPEVQFAMRYRKTMMAGPHSMMRLQRLSVAEPLLAQGMPPEEVATKVGYSDSATLMTNRARHRAKRA